MDQQKMGVAFIGGSGAGKTVVAGLLYMAATTWATQNESIIKDRAYGPSNINDLISKKEKGKTSVIAAIKQAVANIINTPQIDFRKFYINADPKTLEYLKKFVIPELDGGSWPEKTEFNALEKMSIDFILTDGKIVNITLYDISGANVQTVLDLIRNTPSGELPNRIKQENEILAQILNSDVFVFLVDSRLCTPITKDKKQRKERSRQILDLTQIPQIVTEYKHKMNKKVNDVGILLTKHDIVLNSYPLATTKEIEEAMEEHMTDFYTNITGMKKKFGINTIKYFKSGIECEIEKESDKQVPAGPPLRFYIYDYIQLLEWLLQKGSEKTE